jgi:hypothetical protein
VPKSRRRKKKPRKAVLRYKVPITPRAREALLEQRKAFIDKFGREPRPKDPVFFDPNKDVPTPLDPAALSADLEKPIRDAGIDPAKASTIRKVLGSS